MKFLLSLVILVFLCPPVSFSQDAESVFHSIRSPEELALWLSEEFLYRWRLPDKTQTLGETLHSKEGDCEDFAVLASSALTRIGIPNEVLVLRFRDLKIAHAICVWQGKNGLYSFISSQELIYTKKETIEGVIKKFYPDCEKIGRKSDRIYSRL